MDSTKIPWRIFFYKIPSAKRMKNHVLRGSMIPQYHTLKLKYQNTVNPNVPLLNLAVLKPTWKKDQTRCPQDIPTPTCLKPCFILRLWNMHKHFFYALIKQKNCVHFKMYSLLILIQYLICHSILSPPVGVTAFLFFFFSGGCRESRLDCISWIFICCLSGVYPEGRTDVVHSTSSLALC